MKLLNKEELEQSSIVANSLMNRERGLQGSNSYSKDLHFDILDFIEKANKPFSWLDLCCGTGKALIEATELLNKKLNEHDFKIIGIDLVNFFFKPPKSIRSLTLIECSLFDYIPVEKFDLITCVHGLHYIGDKLEIIKRGISWLKLNGLFIGNLDINNIKIINKDNDDKSIIKELTRNGIQYDNKRKIIRNNHNESIEFPYKYNGADDKAGPNYTKQPAVNSFYELIQR